MRALFWASLSVLVVLVASGCTLLVGGGFHVGDAGRGADAGSADAGVDGGSVSDVGPPGDGGDDAGADAAPATDGGADGGTGCAAPSGAVLGAARTIYVSSTAEMPIAIDMSGYTIRAILADGTTQDGTGAADGTFRIDGVPDGASYTLSLVSPSGQISFDVTDRRCIDLDQYVGGRSDAAPVTVSQPMTLHLTNMQPWILGDEIITEVFNTSTEGWDLQAIFATRLAAGATSADATYDFGDTTYNYSYRPGGRPMLIDGSRGDVLQIAHARTDQVLDPSGRLFRTFGAIDLVDVSGVMMSAGAPTTVTGAFVPLERTIPLRFQFNRSAFDAAYTDGRTRYLSTTIGIYGSPAADRGINVGIPLATASLDDWSGTAARTAIVDTVYGDPLPAEWPRVVDQRYQRRRSFRYPGTTTRYAHTVGIDRFVPFAPPLPSMPDLLPPSNVRVGGVSGTAAGLLAFDGSAPVGVTWSGVTAASHYVVEVMRLYPDGALTAVTRAAVLRTADTRIDVPPEVFSGGEFFFFVVSAVRDGGSWTAGHLRLQTLPFTTAGNATGRYHLSATCGDTHVDSGESCDPGTTESATCNADCTPALCGDAVTNVAAGEACDTGFASATCTQACRLPVCGDGVVSSDLEDCDDGNTTDDGNGCDGACHRNNHCGDGTLDDAVEDCDDGNTTDDGNGCDRACHADNVCGNGVTESAIEACDTGGVETMSCDRDCSSVTCGDTHVNAAAGEQCDPPNGTTCSATCHTI